MGVHVVGRYLRGLLKAIYALLPEALVLVEIPHIVPGHVVIRFQGHCLLVVSLSLVQGVQLLERTEEEEKGVKGERVKKKKIYFTMRQCPPLYWVYRSNKVLGMLGRRW